MCVCRFWLISLTTPSMQLNSCVLSNIQCVSWANELQRIDFGFILLCLMLRFVQQISLRICKQKLEISDKLKYLNLMLCQGFMHLIHFS